MQERMIQDERIGSEKRGHGPVEGGRFDGVNPTLQWERWTYQGADMYRLQRASTENLGQQLGISSGAIARAYAPGIKIGILASALTHVCIWTYMA